MIDNSFTGEELNFLLDDCNRLIEEYKNFIRAGDDRDKETLHYFRHKFNSAFYEITYATAYVYKLRTSRDDKSLTQKKAKIGKSIINTRVNGEIVTFSKSDKMYAAASDDYEAILEEREIYYHAYLLFRGIQETIRMFANEIAKRID